MHRWICSSLRGKTWLWDMVINGSFGCGVHKRAGLKILKGGRKESSREEILDFRRALSFCSEMTAGMLREAAVRGKGGQEEKQTYQEMSVCGGMKPTTSSLTSLLIDESVEAIKSIQSWIACHFLGRSEKEELSQQLSQDWDLDVSIADRAVNVSFKAVPGLGEGGRTAEGLRAGSWCQSPEPKSVSRPGSLVSQGFAGTCRLRLPKQLAGQQPRTGRAAGCSGVRGGGDGLAGGRLAPYLQCGIGGQQIAQRRNPPQGSLLHIDSLRGGEVQQHLGREQKQHC